MIDALQPALVYPAEKGKKKQTSLKVGMRIPEQIPPYVIESMVGPRRLELLTSTVSSEVGAVTNRKQTAWMASKVLLRTFGEQLSDRRT
jgi:hypothetical protein